MIYKTKTGRTYSSQTAAQRKQAERLEDWKMLTVAAAIITVAGLLTTWTI